MVLPEGAFSIQADVPFAVEESRDTKYTYLDTAGRPVVVLKKQSTVPEHQQPFTVTYAFSRAKLLHEPALLVSSFAVLFASAVLWVRCDFRITKDEKWRRAREQEETTALLQRIAAVVAGRLCTASLNIIEVSAAESCWIVASRLISVPSRRLPWQPLSAEDCCGVLQSAS